MEFVVRGVASTNRPDVPRPARTNWRDDAACLGVQNYTELPIEEQLSYCNHCPVVSDCLDWGVAIHQDRPVVPGGVYGGLPPGQLAELVTGRVGYRVREVREVEELIEAKRAARLAAGACTFGHVEARAWCTACRRAAS